ncbi:XkdW-like protein [Bacillus phage vB_BcM_Sam112]|uniref:XkdW-like protein n=1 Tax=Bacillus phage vB_BcM_Sam112 TaxID=2663324 RepID=A0A5Q2F4Z2_9CAUD|nr:XkdW-like protein [Bacillus phage vB_BcM_Sam112]
MKDSIIKRYPGLRPEDVRLRDDDDGIYIEYWNHPKVQPSMEDVLKWYEEDMKTYVPPETLEQKAARLERENKELQERTQMLSKSIVELYEFIS